MEFGDGMGIEQGERKHKSEVETEHRDPGHEGCVGQDMALWSHSSPQRLATEISSWQSVAVQPCSTSISRQHEVALRQEYPTNIGDPGLSNNKPDQPR